MQYRIESSSVSIKTNNKTIKIKIKGKEDFKMTRDIL